MKNYNWLIAIVTLAFLASCSQPSKKEEEAPAAETVEVEEVAGPNTLTATEKEEGWMLLFDGSSNTGWRGYKKETFPVAWEIDNEALHIQGSGRGEAGAQDGGDIIYEKEFSDLSITAKWEENQTTI